MLNNFPFILQLDLCSLRPNIRNKLGIKQTAIKPTKGIELMSIAKGFFSMCVLFFILSVFFKSAGMWSADQTVALPRNTVILVNKNVTKLQLQFVFFQVNKVSNDRKDRCANYCLSPKYEN